MTKLLKANPKYRGTARSDHRLQAALDGAFAADPQLKIEYDTELLTLQIAGWVRQLRSKEDLTQKELANRMGVPASFISRIENPESEKAPNLQTLAKLANAFGKKLVVEMVDVESS
jgi:ribosome-binding protein aMBF1 (putative translation factor)